MHIPCKGNLPRCCPYRFNSYTGFELATNLQSAILPKVFQGKFNPIWAGLFANLKRLGGGGAKWPPSDLAISSQMTMKFGRDILRVEIFTN